MLCDFYRIFDEVVSEWRSNANMEDFHCTEGYVEMMVIESKLFKHANEVYTIGAYRLFEEQFMKFLEYCRGLVVCNEVVVLAMLGKVNKKDIASYSAWRREMLMKFSDLISASKLNINARECIEEGFRMMKDRIASEVGPYYVDNSDNEVCSSDIKDPVGRVQKENMIVYNCLLCIMTYEEHCGALVLVVVVIALAVTMDFGSTIVSSSNSLSVSIITLQEEAFGIQACQYHCGPLVTEHHHGPLLVVLLLVAFLLLVSVPAVLFLVVVLLCLLLKLTKLSDGCYKTEFPNH
ncbi:hypothetical protein M9H77_04538 [Catharanthus roseus]|uniref:Uncharacterized protein n=1 Tax=Catharanthus roseus TaxID=4058 RepID=A0ACC0CEJ4_CATRO|nr:hypothetical protein M9H77_04538 [Catharanthus roseus]